MRNLPMMLLVLAQCQVYAQCQIYTSCPASVPPKYGRTFNCSVSIAGGALPAAVEFTFAVGGYNVSFNGAASLVPAKTIQCNQANQTCLVYSPVNDATIQDAAVASAQFIVTGSKLPPSFTIGISPSSHPGSPSAASPFGLNIPVSILPASVIQRKTTMIAQLFHGVRRVFLKGKDFK